MFPAPRLQMHVESLDSQAEIGQEFCCKKAAEFRFWPPAENDVGSNVGYWSLSGLVMLTLSFVDHDVVDGAHSAASKCHRVVGSKRNHIEGSRPWARLSRSGSILRSRCFRFTASM